MPRRPASEVRESAVEDALATYPDILAKTLGLRAPIKIIGRQLQLPNGRLDLLALCEDRLDLIELKVEPFKKEFLAQVASYRTDIEHLQKGGELPSSHLDVYLLVPFCLDGDAKACEAKQVKLIAYSPARVLEAFFSSFSEIAPFVALRPMDYGVWNIRLINRVIYALPERNTIAQLRALSGLTASTVSNLLKLGQELKLVSRLGKHFVLTDLGASYVQARDSSLPVNALSEGQTELLRTYIVKDPFASRTIFGVFSLVEAVFSLARNIYPVSFDELVTYYKYTVGKKTTWVTQRSAIYGCREHSNFAIELGLIARSGDSVFITPAGVRFVLLLQLHKGIKLVDALHIA